MSWLKNIALFLTLMPCLAQDDSLASLQATIKRLRPLHSKMGPPRLGDWVTVHDEPGQTFREYRNCNPVMPTAARRTIYVQPIGEFSPEQLRILDLTVEFMGIYLCLPIVRQETLPSSIIPAKARRRIHGSPVPQFLSPYLLDNLLLPTLPKDAAARIGLTAYDLWPWKGWNFVFGQASTADRVGVWSIHRFGDPAQSGKSFKLCLIRAIGTAVHETCHMFTMLHCTAYACCMCGSNSLEEGDRLPLWLCPECLAKLCWVVKAEPLERFRTLVSFCERNGLEREAKFYKKGIDKLTSPNS